MLQPISKMTDVSITTDINFTLYKMKQCWRKNVKLTPKNIMPNWILNNSAFNVNPVHIHYHFQKICGRNLHKYKAGNMRSSFITSTQIYNLSSDGIRDVSFGFVMHFLGPYDKYDSFSDADIWGVGNEQGDYSHLSLFEASWAFPIISSQRSHFTRYVFFCRALINFQTRAAGHFLTPSLGLEQWPALPHCQSPISALTSHITVLEIHRNRAELNWTAREVWTVGRAFYRLSTEFH
jgi:hypothetical protein